MPGKATLVSLKEDPQQTMSLEPIGKIEGTKI